MKKSPVADVVPDAWSAFVAALVKRIVPTCTDTDVFDQLGVAGLYVMSEEWWDPSTIALHPRMPVPIIPALTDLRTAQLRRLAALGADVAYSWHIADDASLFSCITAGLQTNAVVGLFGITGGMAVQVVSVRDHLIFANDALGLPVTFNAHELRAPAGIECFVVATCEGAHVDMQNTLRWVRTLLQGIPTIAFDTPHHPLRDWQVWHIGADAFAVAAFAAESAAPLAIVSDNVSRIVHAYIWRIQMLRQQIDRLQHVVTRDTHRELLDYCDDALFFMGLLAQQYPPTVERRALILDEGALIAEACRDTRQALRGVIDGLNDDLL